MKVSLRAVALICIFVSVFCIHLFPVNATTLLSDSFTGTTINTSNWTEFDTGGTGGTTGNVQQNGTLTILGTNTAWGTNGVITASTYDRSSYSKSITTTFRTASCAAVAVGGIGYGDTNVNTAGTSSYIVSLNGSALHLYYFNNGVAVSDATVSGFSCSTSTTYTIKLLVKASGGAEVYLNGSGSPGATAAGGTFTNKSFYLQSYSSSLATHDDVVIESADPTAPTAPQGLVAREGNTTLSLSWSAPSSDGGAAITDYLVEYKESTSGTWLTFADGVSTTTTATITGLTNGTTYNTRVSAINTAGTSTAATFTAVPNTVSLSDSFTGTTINTSNWTEFDTGGTGGTTGNVQQNGTLTILGTNTAWGTNGLITTATYDRSIADRSIMTSLRVASCAALATGAVGYGDTNINDAGTTGYIVAVNSSAMHFYYFNNGSVVSDVTVSGFSCSTSTTYTIKLLVKHAGGAELYLNGASSASASVAGGTFTNKSFFIQSYSSSLSTYDDLYINSGISYDYPSTFIGAPKDGAVYLQWSYLSFATDYLVEYKESTSGTWLTFADGVSTATDAVVTGLTNGTAYDFRVTALNGATTYTPTSPIVVTPLAGSQSPFYGHILSTGQSLSIGYNGGPKLTTTQPYSNKMLTSGNGALTALVESVTGAQNTNVETMSAGMANTLSSLTSGSGTYRSVVSLNGVGATAYSGLKQGTTPYNNGLAQISAAYSLSLTAGVPYKAVAVTTIHGESDHLAGATQSEYKGYLAEWQSTYQTDIKAITHQAGTIPLFTDQMASWTGYGNATSPIPLAQKDAADEYPGLIYLVTPKYIFDYSDTAHLTNYSYRRLGEYYGKVIKKVLVDGDTWQPLQPTSVTRLGNIISVNFHVPVPPLQFDTTLVDAMTNYGFEYSDDSNSATITNVAIADSDTVTITLSTVPTGTNQKISYAYTGTPGANPGARVSGAPKGNLRDSDTTPALYTSNIPANTIGTSLYNWGVTFQEPVSLDTDPPTITSVTTTAVNGTYTTGTAIDITTTFSKDVSGTDIVLTLNSGGTCTFSVTNATTGTCTYTVQSGETAAVLTVESITGTIVDGNSNTLVDTTIPQNLDATKSIAIDTTAPVLAEVTPVPTPAEDQTPSYTFSSSEAGTASYAGGCTSTDTAVAIGTNTITFDAMSYGTYSTCQIVVTDTVGNASAPLSITTFVVRAPGSTQTVTGYYPALVLRAQQQRAAASICQPYIPIERIDCSLPKKQKPGSVRLLQQFLKTFGGFPDQKVTGYCGSQTVKNLKSFQQKYAAQILTPLGLRKPTSIAGSATITQINRLMCENQKR